ncbi:MAG: carbamate kinase [Planctomycetota bacterium]
MSAEKTAVVAFGGNALILEDEPGLQEAQIEHAEALAQVLLPFLADGYRLLLVHGNGPQVGNSLIRMEESVTKVPALSLDACVAQTEGSIGYFLEISLRNSLAEAGQDRSVVTLLTHVEVGVDDPWLITPTKPIGPFYSPYRADYLVRMFDWDLVEDAGRGYRRVVASPRPVRVVNADLVKALLDTGAVVIAGGGGGIPVVLRDGRWVGVEAVIDKDYTASLLANAVDANLFIFLTAVDHVFLDHGTERERRLARATVSEAESLLAEGQFPPGSMGPKMEAAISFSRRQGGTVVISSVEALSDALEGRAGTLIVPDESGGGEAEQ